MPITNKLGVDELFEDYLKNDNYQYKDKQYSVTSILTDVRDIILKRRHQGEKVTDVADSCWLFFGTAFHEMCERLADKWVEVGKATYLYFDEKVIDQKIVHEGNETKYYIKPKLKEQRLVYQCKDSAYKLTGYADLYNVITKQVTDYKTASVNKVLYGNWEEYIRQLKLYAVILNAMGFKCDSGRIMAFLKDWSMSESLKGGNYPKSPYYTFEIKFTKEELEEERIKVEEYFKKMVEYEKLTDDELPICNEDVRSFGSKPTFAIMKNKNVRATKVVNTKEQANEYIRYNKLDLETKNTYTIVERPRVEKRCMLYCDVCIWCKHFIENYANYLIEDNGKKYGFKTLEEAKDYANLVLKKEIEIIEIKREVNE